MTNGTKYKRGKLHYRPWHSDICTSNQLNSICIIEDNIVIEENINGNDRKTAKTM